MLDKEGRHNIQQATLYFISLGEKTLHVLNNPIFASSLTVIPTKILAHW